MKNSFSFFFKEQKSSLSQKGIFFSEFFPFSSIFSHLAEPPQSPQPKALQRFPFPTSLPCPGEKMEESRGENLKFSFKNMLIFFQGKKTSDCPPPPKPSSLPISCFCPQTQCYFSRPRRYPEACHGGTGRSLTLGLMSPSPLPAQRAEPVLPAGLSEPFQLSPLAKSAASLLCYLGGPPTCPRHWRRHPWARQSRLRCRPTGAAAAGPGAGDGDKVTSPALRLHGASSSICHGPCTTWHFRFPSSHSVEKLQLCQLFRREGRVGKEKPEETRFLRSFSSPSSGVLPLLSSTDLRPRCSCPSLHPHNKVMLV